MIAHFGWSNILDNLAVGAAWTVAIILGAVATGFILWILWGFGRALHAYANKGAL